MKYEFIYKLFKDYYCTKYVHSHIVGYFRSEAAAESLGVEVEDGEDGKHK